jgi:hypothetical protein
MVVKPFVDFSFTNIVMHRRIVQGDDDGLAQQQLVKSVS